MGTFTKRVCEFEKMNGLSIFLASQSLDKISDRFICVHNPKCSPDLFLDRKCPIDFGKSRKMPNLRETKNKQWPFYKYRKILDVSFEFKGSGVV